MVKDVCYSVIQMNSRQENNVNICVLNASKLQWFNVLTILIGLKYVQHISGAFCKSQLTESRNIIVFTTARQPALKLSYLISITLQRLRYR